MSLNRAVFCSLQLIYLALARPPHYWDGLLVMSFGMVLTFAIFAHILMRPEPNPTRRVFALAADVAALCYVMHLGGGSTALLYPLLLWTILGNGLRFGIGSLVLATLIGVAAFSLVVVSTPFWSQNLSLAIGLLAGLVMLPVYAGILLKSLSAAKLQAEAANQAKTVFLAGVSHELRTPLHAIIGSGSLLQASRLSPEQAELAGTIMQASESLLGLIDDLLQYSKIEAGGLQIARGDFGLPDLLLRARGILLPAAEAKNLRLGLHLDPEMPARLCGDERHLQEILLNLLGNAIKFTSFGGVLVSVRPAEVNGASVRLRFEVADTGIGIPPEAHDRIFERFTQADPSIGRRFGGTGLGLAICRRLVESMGGAIGVRSLVGSGTTFWFELPFEPVAETAATDTVANDALATDTPSWPENLLLLGLDQAATEIVAEVAGKHRASLRSAAFSEAELPGAFRAAARGALVIAAPGTPGETEALVTAVRAHAGNRLPALVVLGTPATATGDIRWIAPTLLPERFGADELEAAIRIAHQLARPPELPERADGAPLAVAPGAHILVADDNRLNQRVVAKILESGGHRFEIVADGSAALDALQAAEYDLVLMDVNMPGMGGIEATKLYRVMAMGERRVPIIGLTADATPEMAERCREAGMDRCVVKPVAARELLAIIEQTAIPRAAAPVESEPHLKPVDEVVLDEEQLDNLRALGGDEFVLELLHGFAEEATELTRSLSEALQENDWPSFRGNAHALASSAANLGAIRVNRLAIKMEQLGPSELKGEGQARLLDMHRELDRLGREAAVLGARQGEQARIEPPVPPADVGAGWRR